MGAKPTPNIHKMNQSLSQTFQKTSLFRLRIPFLH